ncbi:hypothetical protein [Prosthecobacter vanneervenii]|uniref:Uncharacterized protein n=1 Tax=Prosthecobacter vanneervenii TaxID=48466 RepID=A0A7W7YEC5_9BACT|nr:hypothetical protein [Prosthecobacter vanneervenii]MBB5034627.1 hypothetical protein [Prosthecobacter vanneervenii]
MNAVIQGIKSIPNDLMYQNLGIPEQRGCSAIVLEVEADELLEAGDRASALLPHLSDHIMGKLILGE